MPIEILRADITTLDVDAIVNAANERMLGGGGVDGAIHRAAGPELLAACRRIPEVGAGVRCPTGEARVTPGFRLSVRYVIHTVGPIWRGGAHGEADLLVRCYRNALGLARDHHLRSLAFPAISCGVYGYPIDEAATIAVREVQSFLARHDTPARVILTALDERIHRALDDALAGRERATATRDRRDV